MRRLVLPIGSLLFAVPASAHPDHVAGGAVELLHYVTDPFHLATGVLAMGAGALLLAVWRARRGRSVAARLLD